MVKEYYFFNQCYLKTYFFVWNYPSSILTVFFFIFETWFLELKTFSHNMQSSLRLPPTVQRQRCDKKWRRLFLFKCQPCSEVLTCPGWTPPHEMRQSCISNNNPHSKADDCYRKDNEQMPLSERSLYKLYCHYTYLNRTFALYLNIFPYF